MIDDDFAIPDFSTQGTDEWNPLFFSSEVNKSALMLACPKGNTTMVPLRACRFEVVAFSEGGEVIQALISGLTYFNCGPRAAPIGVDVRGRRGLMSAVTAHKRNSA